MSEQSHREEALFEEALKKGSDAERAAFLDGACRDEPELRARLETLLEGHLKAGGFLDSVVRDSSDVPAEAAGRVPITEKPGDRIGRYRLLEKIGEGGCGVVYMAEQEEPVRRRVAFKIIKLGMDTRSVIARFEAERQALALMDHPNIAKVFDAGATETGRPFFVMELVRGIRITDYCDQRQLSTRARLDLFIQVCHAIQHAHQKGIIHRDIKPANILVTQQDGAPIPVVIDFGVAKATEQRLTDKTLFTAFEQFLGTPAYMSPEQAEMSRPDVDTRSDIYALGVLLYELLTGQTPFDARKLLAAGLDEMRRTIREQEPVLPSTRLHTLAAGDLTTTAQRRGTEPPKLVHLVRGDLDWIVMKCLEKDRRRRYETANGLALDLERHLNHEPVVARPPSAAYRVQKFVRRNRLTAMAGSAIAVALLLGVAASAWQALRARRERDRAVAAEEEARAERDKANLAVTMTRAVNDFLIKDLIQQAAPAPGRDPNLTLRAALDGAAARVGERFGVNPAVESVIRETLGNTYRALGQPAAAEEQLRRTYELRRRDLGPDHETTLRAQIHLTLALIDQVPEDLAKAAEAEQMLNEALETSRRVLGPAHPDTLGLLNNLAQVYFGTGRTIASVKVCEQILELHRQAGGTNTDLTLDTRAFLATTYLNALGRAPDAEPLHRAVFERELERNGPEHPRTLIALENLGCTLERLGRYAEAEPIFQQVLEGRRRVLGPSHPHARIALRKLAGTYATCADWERCLPLVREMARLEPAEFGSDPLCYVAWMVGDTDTCREQLEILTRRFPWNGDPNISKVPALACLILPELVSTLEPALRVADAVAEQQPDWPYNRILKALADYRRGRWAEATRWVQPWQGHFHTAVASPAGYVLALAQHQLGETEAAHFELDRANRRLEAFLRAGNLQTPHDRVLRWQDFAQLAILRAEAERVILGRPVSPRLDAAFLHACRERWAPVQKALDRGNYLAGARRWNEARDAFAQALEHPAFDWSVAEAPDANTSLQIGVAFLQARDTQNLERLCQSLFDRLDAETLSAPSRSTASLTTSAGTRSTASPFNPSESQILNRQSPAPLDMVNPITVANVTLVYLLQPDGRSPELTNRAVSALDWAEQANVDAFVRIWFRLVRGLAQYRSGQDADAAKTLMQAEESAVPGTRGPAKAFRAMILQRSGQTAEAERLLSEAESILSKSIENRPYDWRNWSGCDLGQLALEEARQLVRQEKRP